MTALNKHVELRQLAGKASQGEWWSDVVETDGEYGEGEDRASGYHSYAVYVGSESLLDMTNSTTACIHEEWDHDYHMAWDETAKRNAEFIAAANPSTVLALLDELEAAQKLATQQGNIAVALLDEVTMLRRNANDNAPELRECLEAAERRIAELEAKLANPVLLPKTNGYWNEQEKAHEEAITLAKRQIRLAGFRCEGDE